MFFSKIINNFFINLLWFIVFTAFDLLIAAILSLMISYFVSLAFKSGGNIEVIEWQLSLILFSSASIALIVKNIKDNF